MWAAYRGVSRASGGLAAGLRQDWEQAMFLRCRNSPAPCGRGGLARGSAPGPRQPLRRVASLPGGRLEHTPPPSGRGKLRVSPPPLRFSPRREARACVRRRSATVRERAPTSPTPTPAPRAGQSCQREEGLARSRQLGGDFLPACESPLGGPPRQGRGGWGAGVQPLPHPSLATVKCAFQVRG